MRYRKFGRHDFTVSALILLQPLFNTGSLMHPKPGAETVVLSGMSTMDQVVENTKTAQDALPMSLTEEDLVLIAEARAIYKQKIKMDCTGCGYCMPCPNRVRIPEIFSIYNDVFMYGAASDFSSAYNRMKEAKVDASACAECGRCEEACPQNLPVARHLKEVREFFEARGSSEVRL